MRLPIPGWIAMRYATWDELWTNRKALARARRLCDHAMQLNNNIVSSPRPQPNCPIQVGPPVLGSPTEPEAWPSRNHEQGWTQCFPPYPGQSPSLTKIKHRHRVVRAALVSILRDPIMAQYC
jgi:hypothetical protein